MDGWIGNLRVGVCIEHLTVLIISLWEVFSNMLQYNRCEFESMKASCGPEQQASKKDAMGTEEKCMYEYNLTLSFKATMGRSVHTIPDKTIKAC